MQFAIDMPGWLVLAIVVALLAGYLARLDVLNRK
jgi:hypothetical protein